MRDAFKLKERHSHLTRSLNSLLERPLFLSLGGGKNGAKGRKKFKFANRLLVAFGGLPYMTSTTIVNMFTSSAKIYKYRHMERDLGYLKS